MTSPPIVSPVIETAPVDAIADRVKEKNEAARGDDLTATIDRKMTVPRTDHHIVVEIEMAPRFEVAGRLFTDVPKVVREKVVREKIERAVVVRMVLENHAMEIGRILIVGQTKIIDQTEIKKASIEALISGGDLVQCPVLGLGSVVVRCLFLGQNESLKMMTRMGPASVQMVISQG